MTIQELLPLVRKLDRADKLRLMQSLLYELAQDEGVSLLDPEQLLMNMKAYPIWSPINSFEAADALLQALEQDTSNA